MSLNSAAGSGGAATPGWYTDPQDPRQLRWWSGEGWTEHVSPGAADAQVVEQAVAAPVPAAQPVQADQPVQEAQTVAQVQPVQAAQPVQPTQDAPLPSRRALREPSAEASDASAAAEAALAGQAAAQAQAEQQAAAQAAYVAPQAAQPVEPAQPAQPVYSEAPQSEQPPSNPVPVTYAAPVADTPTQSTPVPTLPVAPTSFLEQQGYAPLDGAAPTEPAGWGGVPAVQPQAVQPQAVQPALVEPPLVEPPLVQAQAVQPQSVQPQAVQPAQLPPVGAGQPNAWNQPAQPVQPTLPAQPSAWNQPAQPTQPDQQNWGAPTASPGPDGMDSLFGGPAIASVADENPQTNQWGLSPTDAAGEPSRRGSEVAGVAGSSSFWAWLIAISPILAAGSIAYVLLTTKAAVTSWQFEAAIAAPFLLVLLFALADRAALLNLGHTNPRSPAWALLSAPIYLIARAGETRREDGSGTLLTVVWFVSFLVAIGGIVGYGFLTHHALIAGLPT